MPSSEMWRARIGAELAAQLREDAQHLGLNSRTDMVKEGLWLLHQVAAQERMARNVEEFYGGKEPPVPIGVRRREAG